MPRGRPLKSEVRDNIAEILFFKKYGCGYEISKIYNQIFPKVSQRVIYYHLNRGAGLEEFEIKKVKKEKGNYSWGKMQSRKEMIKLELV